MSANRHLCAHKLRPSTLSLASARSARPPRSPGQTEPETQALGWPAAQLQLCPYSCERTTLVSLITTGSATGPDGSPYPRRRATGWLIMVAALTVVATIVWIAVATRTEKDTAAMSCPSPNPPTAAKPGAPAPAQLGKRVGTGALTEIQPAPLPATKVRVYNANNQSGQATHVAAGLSDKGFASPPDMQYGNDPVYVDQNMQCVGQIRYGTAGRRAAASVQLMVPCAELIEDTRTDDTVDLALGTYFGELRPNREAEEILRTLREPGTNSAALDSTLLTDARKSKC